MSRDEGLCDPVTSQSRGDGVWHVALDPSKICQATDITLVDGTAYHVQVVLPPAECGAAPQTFDPTRKTGQWADRTVPVETPHGFSSTRGPAFMAALPFRRILTSRWLVPVAAVGDTLPQRHALASGSDTETATSGVAFTTGRGGRLTLFVNDAILPVAYDPVTGFCMGWDCYYRNNTGAPALVVVATTDAWEGERAAPPTHDCVQQTR